MKLLKTAFGLTLCLALAAWKSEIVEAARFWRPIFGIKNRNEEDIKEDLSGILVV